MSSAVISTSAAGSRPFLFDDDSKPEVSLLSDAKKPSGASLAASIGNGKWEIKNSILPASRLAVRPAPEMVSSGIPALDDLTGGLPRGCLTEICGQASSGRTTVLLAALAAAIRRDEFCVVVDASDAFDPHSAVAVGADLDHLLWVRCGEDSPRPEHRLEQALRVTDLLLESGGFGLIILDLADLPVQAARRIPLATWFRFRRAIEYKPTILLAIEQQPIAGSCSSLLLELRDLSSQFSVVSSNQNSINRNIGNRTAALEPKPSHAHLLTGVEIHVELIRSRLERKPARSVMFASKTAWAG